jgi:hypothetical protein
LVHCERDARVALRAMVQADGLVRRAAGKIQSWRRRLAVIASGQANILRAV